MELHALMIHQLLLLPHVKLKIVQNIVEILVKQIVKHMVNNVIIMVQNVM